jgi:hypothetical protein
MPVFKVQTKPDKEPQFGSVNLGDTVKLSIRDPRFPNGIELQKRLLRWELSPPSSDGAEEASWVFEGDTDV